MKRGFLSLLSAVAIAVCTAGACFAIAGCGSDSSDNTHTDNIKTEEGQNRDFSEVVVDGIEFFLRGEKNTCFVSGYSGAGGQVIVPSTVLYGGINYTVTHIEEPAFTNCSSITSVIISEGVKLIGELSFSNCVSLESVVIPDSVTSIGARAFENCQKLASVSIPQNVTYIGQRAFKNCTSLVSATFKTLGGWNVDGENLDLSDPAVAAKYLNNTYCAFFWARN